MLMQRIVLTALLTVSAQAWSPPKSILDIAIATPELSTLVTALNAAGLEVTLSGTGPFTVFAPSNNAFAALGQPALTNLLKPENKAQLVDLLTYHFAVGDAHAKDLMGMKMILTEEGRSVKVRTLGKDIFLDSAKVTTADVDASNGVVHLIDSVLMPDKDIPIPLGTIVDLAEGSEELTTFVTAIKKANLVDLLSSPGAFTIFAPTNGAFAALPEGLLAKLLSPGYESQLQDLLTYHVAAGDVHTKDFKDNEKLKTVEGKDVTIRVGDVKGTGFLINTAEIIVPDFGASNGVVHYINQVLMQSDAPAPVPAPVSDLPLCRKVSDLNSKPKGWQCRCDGSDTDLTLTKKGLTEFTKTTLVGCENIVILFLDSNQITEIATGTFTGLPKLGQLILSGNQINVIAEDAFLGMIFLDQLLLTDNRITTIPRNVFTNLDNLRTLYLNNNQISVVPEGVFTYGVSLQLLQLQHNSITTIAEAAFTGLSKPPNYLTLVLCNNPIISSFPVGALAGLDHTTTATLGGPTCN